MKAIVRNTLAISLMALLAVGLTCLLHSSREKRAMTTCTDLKVEFADDWHFVSEDDVRNCILGSYGTFIGQRIDSVGLDKIENILEQRSVVMGSEAWMTSDGVLHISIEQRAPKIRFQKGNSGFYMDETGYVFPLHKSYTADVQLITGNIPDLSDGRNADWARGTLALVDFIRNSKTWRGRVSAISVNPDGDMELRIGEDRERFIFGSPDRFDEKFSKIDKYYSYIATGDENAPKYRSVNLKYNKQLICRKDI